MNSTQFSEFAKVAEQIANAIAQTEVLQYLEQQVNAIARLPRQIQTPQRRAKLHDKQRIRRKDAKEWALRRSGCSNTAEVKKYLKVLGKKLDLRLTSAWIAVNKEFAEEIKQLTGRMPDLKLADMFSVGDRVTFKEYSARTAYLASWSPFVITELKGGEAFLDIVSFPVALSQLVAAV